MRQWLRIKKRADEKGQILVVVLVLITFVSLLVTSLLGFIGTGISTGQVYHEKTAELYAADAGIEDGVWIVKYNHLSEEIVGYDAFDFSTDSWVYSINEPINDKNVDINIRNIWIPSNIPVPDDPDEARSLIETGKLLITGRLDTTQTNTYKVKISYYPDALDTIENLMVETIGVWLPGGFVYGDGDLITSDSLFEEDDMMPYYAVPAVTPHMGGHAVVWTFADNTAYIDFPGIDNINQPVLETTFTFKYTPEASGSNLDAISWITTSGIDDIPYTWDSDTGVFRIISNCEGTQVDALISRNKARELSAAHAGDYRAIGNSLMGDAYTAQVRWDLLDESSATVDDIPEDAEVDLAYLYWSGWFGTSTSAISPFPDDCADFDLWTVSSIPAGSDTRVPTSVGDSDGVWVMPAQIRRPTGDGDISGTWDSAPRWDDVDEETADDADYVTGTTDTGGHLLFSFTPFDVPAGATNINLTVYIRARDTSNGGNNIYERIKVNGSYYDGSSHNPGTGATDYSYTWSVNPFTGLVWTENDINGTGAAPLQQFGVYSTDLNPDMRVTMVYAEVSYTAPELYTQVDETVADDADYVTGTTDTGGYLLFNFTPFDVPAGANITNLKVKIRVMDAIYGTNYIRERIKVNGSYYNGSSHNPGTTATDYTYTWSTNPSTGLAWTANDINGTGATPLQQIGIYSNDLNPDMRVTMVYAEVNWTGNYGWSINSGKLRGQGSSNAPVATRTLTLTDSLDLSGYPSGSVMLTWTQTESGTLEEADTLYFALSENDGVNWGPNIKAFNDDSPTSAFSYVLPDNYLTDEFKFRFYYAFDATDEYVYVDNISVSTLPCDDTAFLEIDGQQVYFDGGVPTQGAGLLTAEPGNIQILPDESEGGAQPTGYFYSCKKDITELIRAFGEQSPAPATNRPGNGEYTVGGVDIDVGDQKSYAGWSIIIIYSSAETQGHQLYLFDKMVISIDDTNVDWDKDGVAGGTINGFLVPSPVLGETIAAKMTAFIGEGDGWLAPEYFEINGTTFHDGTGETNNVWNGKSVGMNRAGVDVDTFTVTWASGVIQPGDTSAQIIFPTGEDTWQLLYLVLAFRSEIFVGGHLNYLIE